MDQEIIEEFNRGKCPLFKKKIDELFRRPVIAVQISTPPSPKNKEQAQLNDQEFLEGPPPTVYPIGKTALTILPTQVYEAIARRAFQWLIGQIKNRSYSTKQTTGEPEQIRNQSTA